MIKRCSKCALETHHNLRKNGKYTYAWCADCMIEYKKRYYQENKQSYRKRQKKTDNRRRDRAQNLVCSAKDTPCVDCGIKYPYYVMQFDHLGDKEYTIARMITKSISLIQKEIDKCEVVCANCHAERTHGPK